MKHVTIIILLLLTFAAQARDKWDVTAAQKRWLARTDRAAAAQTITAGGCTVTVLPYFVGAQLTFTCAESAWNLYVRNTDKGLQVRRAEFRRTPAEPYMRVLFEANIAEIFVPYHDGITRLSDNQWCYAAACIQEVTAQDLAGANGELITMAGDSKPTAAVELRDRGLAWMCKSGSGSLSRRGQDMVVWGTWDTGNYDYVIEYTFRDDGQISFRIGATGWDNDQLAPGLAHMHDILWRVDLDLNGDSHDSALLASHVEQGTGAIDGEQPFNLGKEGADQLEPLNFETLIVEDAAVNKRGNHLGYELQPFRRGIARHVEDWCQDDVWVTRYHGNEPAVPSHWTPPGRYLLGDAQNPVGTFNAEPIAGEDIVIWHSSPIHHVPHDEDQSPTDPGSDYRGLTLVHWTGFDLVPHNLFDATPLGGPDRSLCQ